MKLDVKGLNVSYADKLAVSNLDLSIDSGEFVAVLGHSGSGKSTLLRAIAGFVQPKSGEIWAGNRDLVNVPINRRNVGIVFQQYALFPHMNVAQNVEYGLKVARIDRKLRQARVAEELERVSLSEYWDRRPSQLSGGQQQRAAVARALAMRPSIVLFDEPLSNLDAVLRSGLRMQIKELQRNLGFTAMFVTHDHREAMALGDRMAVMEAGNLRLYGEPEDLYENPKYASLARLLGGGNLLDCEVVTEERDKTVLDWYGHRLVSSDVSDGQHYVKVVIRLEKISLMDSNGSCPTSGEYGSVIECEVLSKEYQGDRTNLLVETLGGGKLECELQRGERESLDLYRGSKVQMFVRSNDVRIVQ